MGDTVKCGLNTGPVLTLSGLIDDIVCIVMLRSETEPETQGKPHGLATPIFLNDSFCTSYGPSFEECTILLIE